ncbi:MAG: ABC transporter permease subunit [Alphaproteobacteria bacterium]|jgi:glycine betaine/proline transport system permease protein|nr:ABC transporter permease subunit [Alphaproteobacteria bacterium]MBT6240432.1 ABC transporter permease subunit [Rhodospirillaceae bacterium]MBT7746768.1 ABC transporter permease subunit [Alphaproteobacteria bacterium]
MNLLTRHSKLLQFTTLLVVFFALYFSVDPSENNMLWRLPAYLAGVPAILNDSVEFLMFEWIPIEKYNIEIEDYEETALLREITRSISGALLFCIELVREILLGGVKTIVAFTSWDYVRDNSWAQWPALPWTVVSGSAIVLGYALKGKWLALLAGFATIYIAVFGQWEPAMETLSFVMIAAPLSVFLGLVFGVWAYKSRVVEAALMPLLNIAQTMPHFSYLVPVTVFFGVGDHAGAIATVIFATPPMIRLTLLGLKSVPTEVIEAGIMNGCNKYQLLFKVLIPSERHQILIGVNQVIMQCLAMAVIASFIGAKGLGFNLLLALNQLRIGQALELGICIVLIAVVLDKLSLGWANKQIDYFADLSFLKRHKYPLILGGVLLTGILLAYIGSFIFKDGINYFYLIPHNKGITTENFWQSGVDWMVDNWYQGLQVFNTALIVNVLLPMKHAYLSMPVSATFVLVMGIGYIIGGIRSALVVGGFLLYIATTEWWDRALITAYMTTIGVIVSAIIGIAVGSLCAQKAFATKFILLVCDTLQTFPSFIYLIPVIMLFGVTDTSVLIAVIIYATIPAIRYTVEGLRNVPQSLQDAGTMSGVNRLQRLVEIELPLAFPHIMLGINQTVVFALFMVIIGAMIGTDDLGQYILKALSDKNGTGNGLMLGLCVAFIGLTVDHLILRWSAERKKALGVI